MSEDTVRSCIVTLDIPEHCSWDLRQFDWDDVNMRGIEARLIYANDGKKLYGVAALHTGLSVEIIDATLRVLVEQMEESIARGEAQ